MNFLTVVILIFSLLGLLDRIIGNKFGLGSEFARGFSMFGVQALSSLGILILAPAIGVMLMPAFEGFYSLFGIDPSVIPASIFANDMGGTTLSLAISKIPTIGLYNAFIVSSMMGCTISYTIPVATGMVDVSQHKDMFLGFLCGIATIPVGCVVSGLMLKLDFGALLLNLLPVLLVSLITCLGLMFAPNLSRRIFRIIGVIVLTMITVGLSAGIFTHLTGVTLIPYMAPVTEGFSIVCEIAILLAGVFPMIAVISKIFHPVLRRAGALIHIDESSVLGLISSLANSIPTFDLVKNMNAKGIMMNMAFAVSASFVLGDHLAFTMAFDAAYLPAMIVGKLTGGVSAVAVACLLYRRMEKKEHT